MLTRVIDSSFLCFFFLLHCSSQHINMCIFEIKCDMLTFENFWLDKQVLLFQFIYVRGFGGQRLGFGYFCRSLRILRQGRQL